MLSAETASGEYPLEAVQMMSKIIRQVENGPDYQTQLDVSRPKAEATVSDAISCAIRRISNVLPVAVLINYSESDASGLRAARERPTVPILNLTPNLQTARRLTVAWGVHSVVNDRLRQVDEVCSTKQPVGSAWKRLLVLCTQNEPYCQTFPTHYGARKSFSLGSLGRPKGGRCDTYQCLAMLAGTKIRYRPEVRGLVDVIQAALFDLLLILTEQSELAIRLVSPRSVSRFLRQISGKTKTYSKTRSVMRYQVVSKRDIEYRLISS